jgi:hypothetical protein
VTDEAIAELLNRARRIAVVGLSPRPDRPSHAIAAYLVRAGYEVVPVNPEIDEVMGLRAYPDLRGAPGPIDIVDIFRRSEFVGPIVDEAIEIGAGAIWMQDGVIDEAAAARARARGLTVVMDDCILRRHAELARRRG